MCKEKNSKTHLRNDEGLANRKAAPKSVKLVRGPARTHKLYRRIGTSAEINNRFNRKASHGEKL